MSRVELTSDWDNLLIAKCNLFDWDQSAQNWKSDDGNWYTLNAKKLTDLTETLELLIQISKLGTDRQLIIANYCLDFLKNILSCPKPYPEFCIITFNTWQLMFNLISGNRQNESRVWNECGALLLNYLEQDFQYKDTCRLITYCIYTHGGKGKHDGTSILKTLLNSFRQEKQTGPLKEQGLTMFLDYFIVAERNMSTMYHQLSGIEVVELLHYTIDYIGRKQIVDYRLSPISMDVLFCICNDFNSKSEHTFHSSFTDTVYLQQIFALLDAIAVISNDNAYKLNKFNFDLVQNVGRILNYVLFHEEEADAMFSAVKRNSTLPLTLLMLTTISNLVKDNNDHKEKARDGGLINSLVDFIAGKGSDKHTYRYTIYTLIDICQTNPLNMEYVEQIVKNRDDSGSEMLQHLLLDIKWKGRK